MLLVRLVVYLTQCGFRLWKLTIALTFRCVSSLCSAAATSAPAHSCANQTSSSRNSCNSSANNTTDTDTDTDTDSIAKLDLIEALDIEIESLAKEKQFYEQYAKDIKLSEEKQLKAQHKVAQLNTRMMVLTRRVLKLREELENGKTSI